ncbi:MAG: glycosyltransferase [Flavobacteriales bacterium]
MNRVLFIGHQWPDPNATAAGVRILQLLRHFNEKGMELHFASAAQVPDHISQLRELGCIKHSIQLNHISFDAFIAELDPHIVVFDRFMVEEQFGWRVSQTCPVAIRILDLEDLHCLRKARQLAVEKNKPFHLDDLKSETALREVASIFRSDLSLVISEAEMQLLNDVFHIPDSIRHYLPFLPESIQEREISILPSFENRTGFVSIGNFLHAPNKDALRILKNEIWPLIQKQIPDAILNAYGSHASAEDLKLNDLDSGFLVHGRAESADDVIRNSRVLIAPLRFGAGQKGKLIDAMRNGTPSVTTHIGAEGMSDGIHWGGAIEDDFERLATRAVELHENAETWKVAQDQGFQLLNQRFDRAEYTSSFDRKLESISEHLTEHRNENFIGKMLMHHTHKSTEYMSRWIEAKNRK